VEAFPFVADDIEVKCGKNEKKKKKKKDTNICGFSIKKIDFECTCLAVLLMLLLLLSVGIVPQAQFSM